MIIPKVAKRVFKGVIFDVYQWEQKMYDGTIQTFEMLKRPDTVQVIPVAGDKIWLAEEEQPHYKLQLGFFGGRVEEGESPLAAAKRELLEEAGLASDDWEIWKSYEPHQKIDWTVYYLVARDCRKVSEPSLDAGERMTVQRVSFEDFFTLVRSGKFDAGQFEADMSRLASDPKALAEFCEKLFGSK